MLYFLSMGGKEAFHRILHFKLKPSAEKPASPRIDSTKRMLVEHKNIFERCGYDSERKVLKDRIDSILGENWENLRDVVEEAEEVYSRKEVVHLGWRDSELDYSAYKGEQNKKEFARHVAMNMQPPSPEKPNGHKAPQREGAIKLAVAVDFARRMVEEGRGDEIRSEWTRERDMFLGNDQRVFSGGFDEKGNAKISGGLSGEEALKTVGPQDIGLIHEGLERIAQGNGESHDEAYANRVLAMTDRRDKGVIFEIVRQINQGAAEPKVPDTLYDRIKKRMRDYGLAAMLRGR